MPAEASWPCGDPDLSGGSAAKVLLSFVIGPGGIGSGTLAQRATLDPEIEMTSPGRALRATISPAVGAKGSLSEAGVDGVGNSPTSSKS